MNGPGTVALIGTAGIGAQHLQIAKLNGMLAPDRPDDARHRNRPAVAVDHRSRIFDVDAVERGSEAVGITFAPLLAVGDDVEPGTLLITNGENRGVVLRGFELVRRDKPKIVDAHARNLLRQLFAVDQPLRLRIGTDQ